MKILITLPVRLDGDDHGPGVEIDVAKKTADGLIATGAAAAVKAVKAMETEPKAKTKPAHVDKKSGKSGKGGGE